MNWKLEELEGFQPADIFSLVKKHRLAPVSGVETANMCNHIAENSACYELRDTIEDNIVAIMLVHGAGSEIAEIDFVPQAGYFTPGTSYHSDLRESVLPVFRFMFEHSGVRRISASVPASRKRTIKVLKALGFSHEGCQREGVAFYGRKTPEDLILYGLLAKDGV